MINTARTSMYLGLGRTLPAPVFHVTSYTTPTLHSRHQGSLFHIQQHITAPIFALCSTSVSSPKRDTPTCTNLFPSKKALSKNLLPAPMPCATHPKTTSCPPHRAIAPPNNASHPCPAHGKNYYLAWRFRFRFRFPIPGISARTYYKRPPFRYPGTKKPLRATLCTYWRFVARRISPAIFRSGCLPLFNLWLGGYACECLYARECVAWHGVFVARLKSPVCLFARGLVRLCPYISSL